jgi:hypothetical protein
MLYAPGGTRGDRNGRDWIRVSTDRVLQQVVVEVDNCLLLEREPAVRVVLLVLVHVTTSVEMGNDASTSEIARSAQRQSVSMISI